MQFPKSNCFKLKVVNFLIFKGLAYNFLDDTYRFLLLNHKSYVRDLSGKIIHLSIKIKITPEDEGEKRHNNLNRLFLLLLQIKITASSYNFFNL